MNSLDPALAGESLGSLYDVILLDLDGVVYRGPEAIPHAVESLNSVTARCAFVTNNAARPAPVVAEHLRALGLAATADDVVTSAQAGADLLCELVPPGARVLAVGGEGVAIALRERGFTVIATGDPEELSDGVDALMMGYGADVSWRDLAAAAYAVNRGVPFVATNTDASIPTARGVAPGNGTLVAAVVTATGRQPLIAGKPYPPLLLASLARTGAGRALFVGDRLDTDIAGAVAVGIDSLLVLTGVHGLADLATADPIARPTYVADDLRGLLRTPAEVVVPMSVRQAWAELDRDAGV